jgi:TM2 domain-containing membrane protein YozV
MTQPTNKPAIAFCRQSALFLCVLIYGFLLVTTKAHAQNTTQQQNTFVEEPVFIPSPAKAAMLSATLPGLGQIYNRKYWKLPIIYAGFGTLAYFVDFNSSNYSMWRRAWLARVDGNPNTIDDFPLHSTDVLERAMNFYRRNLEITYILAAALYLLNILDASVDAHLMNFDVGEKLSLGLQPVRTPATLDQLSIRHTAEISFILRF